MDEANDEDRLGTAAPLSPRAYANVTANAQLLPPRHEQDYRHQNNDPLLRHHHQQPYNHANDPSLSPTDPFAFDAAAQANFASHAALNLQVVAANAATAHAHAAASNLFANVPDPDDFYRDYRGVQTGPAIVPVPSPPAPMASTTLPQPHALPHVHPNSQSSASRQPAAPAKLTHAATAPAGHSGTRPALRSASGSSGYGLGKQPSVKDLKKRFDQAAPPPPQPAVPRQVSTRTAALRSTSQGRPSGGSNAGQAAASYTNLRSSVDKDAGSSSSRSTRRQKFVEEDQMSSNPKSFASRMRPKPPNPSIVTGTHSSKTASAASARSPSVPTSPRSGRPGGLLFGEILPQEDGGRTAGFGIHTTSKPRRTSESQIYGLSPLESNQSPAGDEEPSSPTDWYRGVASPRPSSKEARLPQTSHARAQSDSSGAKSALSRPPHPRQNRRSGPPSQPPSPSSRLPISVKKLSPSSNPSSPSSRSNSPSFPHNLSAGGRSSRQRGTSTTRAKTPTTRSTTPTTSTSKTATHNSAASRRHVPSKIATPVGHTAARLAAFNAAASPAKLSPPLRSSRPRQSVASASTASSRLKTVEKSGSSKPAPKEDDPTPRRRKLSVGPIDFAQRRETIKLAYTKSIRETQAREARYAASLKRKKEQEDKVKAEAEAAAAEAAAAAALAAAAIAGATPTEAAPPGELSVPVSAPSEPTPSESVESSHGTDSSITRTHVQAQPDSEPQLRIITGSVPVGDVAVRPAKSSLDSPTLGIPGSFPSFGSPQLDQEPPPQSAISTTSVITEFDHEPQTEPASMDGTAVTRNGLGIDNTSIYSPVREKATYHSPFDENAVDDDQLSIKISLDALTLEQRGKEPASSADGHEQEQLHQSHEDEDVRQQSFEASFEGQLNREKQVSTGDLPPTALDDQEQEYEPRPFMPQAQHTTVTILSRESDFMPRPKPNDGPISHEPQMDSLEEFYIGPHIRDNISALRDSTFMSSEFSDDFMPSSAEAQRTPDTSQSLTVPGLLSPANRTSQHSAWTDFSLDSSDGGMERLSKHAAFTSRDSTLRGRPAMLAAESRPASITEDIRGEHMHHDADSAQSEAHLLGTLQLDRHQLPELDTGYGFSVDYMSTPPKKAHVPARPDHEPPPVPTPDNRSIHEDHRPPSSGYYDQTRPSSYFQSTKDDESTFSIGPSRRQSEEYAQPLLTPHSIGGASMESTGNGFSTSSTLDVDPAATASDEAKDPASSAKQGSSKERNRLVQRQNVIKELIDTEGSFVRDMNVIEEIYKGTAEACPNLDSKTIKLIFRNTDEIIGFHTTFLAELKESVSVVYSPKGRRSPLKEGGREDSMMSDSMTIGSTTSASVKEIKETAAEPDDSRDRLTSIGPVFAKNIERMRVVHESFLKTSDPASKRLIQIQEDDAVQVWLSECNEAAKDLTAAWNLDSLLIKPMQRITKYPNLIIQLLQYTPEDHPDREALTAARVSLENAILDINKTKKNFELVGQIVGRKRKESDVRAGFARAFGKRIDKLQSSSAHVQEDTEYKALQEKFGDDFLRLQVVLRDVEFYTRQVSEYVREFLQMLSAMELVMRLQPSPYPEIESKWARFNVSMRDMEKVALDQHLAQVRKHVIEPFELVIRCYNHPGLAMKKRTKRRADYERAEQLKKGGKKVDKQLGELVEQYEALNETLKKELPKLSAYTEKIGNICLGNFVCIQVRWFSIWKEKVKVVLEDAHVPEMADVVQSFQRDFRDMEEQIGTIGLLNHSQKPRSSQSTTEDNTMSRSTSRVPELSPRARGLSSTSDSMTGLATPDFVRTNSGQFTLSPTAASSTPHHYYFRDQYAGLNVNGHSRHGGHVSPAHAGSTGRPGTGRSYDAPRPSGDSANHAGQHSRRDSGSTYNSNMQSQEHRRFSGLFHSALPPDDPDERGRASRSSSRERPAANGYNVMWLAASLFEFKIEETKTEAGYPYLTYQPGEIFDVIAEKGELWLAKNQDDPSNLVGWIWSKHFAKLADS
ncbi:hypothetical protein MAPG_06758 [Magnaporthiopsis poae ATCC 64411]|uniref:DH domain-containing protein n=1 Tax=Magnaporthiopsis poae (strain ATCC 64411 / 73-15) TaxID=644358 RepID=A0A0C4E2W6_MAGP6|nr:hypothetical protein MAPG_06758 [Magnaporthiopsis poae ATCC 64411]